MLQKESVEKMGTKNEVKKQRVEQVVTALYKGESINKRTNSIDNNNEKKSLSPRPNKIPSPDSTESIIHKQMPTLISSHTEKYTDKTSTQSNEEAKNPPSAFVPHQQQQQSIVIRPQAVLPCCSSAQQRQQQMPFFPVPRVRGIHIDSKVGTIMKVPRDKTFPFNVYDPKKTSKSSSSAKEARDKNKPYSSVKPYKKHSSASSKVKSPTSPPQEYKYIEYTQDLVHSNHQNITQYRPPHLILSDGVPTKNTTMRSTSSVKKNVKVIENETFCKQLDEWDVEEVYDFLRTTDCAQYASIFLEQEIDGKVLLLLDETNISKLLGVKMGPAIKLNSTIQNLKKSASFS